MHSTMLSMHPSDSSSQATRDISLLSTFQDQWKAVRLLVFQVCLHARLAQPWHLSRLRRSLGGRLLDSPPRVVVTSEGIHFLPSLTSARECVSRVQLRQSPDFRSEVLTVLCR